MSIRLLDCTLRDGGYVNIWNFGSKEIYKIIKSLTEANIDYIELGFLQSKTYDPEKTLFRYMGDMSRFIPEDRKKTKYCCMITFGDYAIEDLPERSSSSVDACRIIFKKNNWRQALEYCRKVKDKGYEIFINPMHTYAYTDKELLEIIDEVNHIKPDAFTIVDTMGIMNADELVRMFLLVDHNLHTDINIGVHFHNNLQQAFTNAKSLVDLHSERNIVIDVSVMGMGRGAGNLNAELMISHLNEKLRTSYNILPILKICDEQLLKVFTQKPWGYSVPYFLAAEHKCHPNYASYLTDKQTITVEAINAILDKIPETKKRGYDEELVKKLYLGLQENNVDDADTLQLLAERIGSRPVLIIAPGASIKEKISDINAFIKEKHPFIVSLNFSPAEYDEDIIFVSNIKRFEDVKDHENLMITSNINVKDIPTLNYSSYLNDSDMYDNCCLMMLSALMKINIFKVYLAGMDGFKDSISNYYMDEMENNARLGEFDRRNVIMRQTLKNFSKKMNITFLTPSYYQDE